MRCFLGHDHATRSIWSSVQERYTLGQRALDSFHCEEHKMQKREGNWRSMDLKTAEILELVPCRMCFPDAWREFRESREQPS